MTYRATRGGRAGRRAAHKRAQIDTEVHAKSRAWLASHPPRLDPPLCLGTWPEEEAYDATYVVDFKPTPRPDCPVWRVPIAPTMPMRLNMGRDLDERALTLHTLDMRAVRMTLRAGATRLSWWSWEPTRGQFVDGGTQEADIYRAASRVQAFLPMVREIFAKMGFDRYMVMWGYDGAFVLRCLDELDEGLRQWRGGTRVRYSIPGERTRDAPEERVGEQGR